MAEIILKDDAEKILLSAFRTRCSKKDDISASIQTVLKGNHKTYKYVLINGLLAKATNDKINALALQAGAPITGAFDARTLCHKVIVPFERDFLQNAFAKIILRERQLIVKSQPQSLHRFFYGVNQENKN